MAVGAIQPVAAEPGGRGSRGPRERLCQLLRAGAPPSSAVSDGVLDVAREEDLHLLLADRLGLSSHADELRVAAAVEMLRERELRDVLNGLAAVGIAPIVIKGAALALTHYPRPELRPRVDSDLMISAAEREQTARALLSLGYQRASEIAGDVAIGQFHFHRVDRRGLLHALDVHWRVSNVHAFSGALTYEELARDAVSLPSLGTNGWGPSAVHALFVACIHRVAHHGDSESLLWLFDVHLLARDLSQLERRSFTELATARRMRRVCARGLRLAANAFGGIDDAWIASLEDWSGASEASAIFVGQELRQVDILKADFQALPQWRERAQMLREHLFPPAEYMREKYRTWPGALLPVAYLHRIIRGAPRWFR